MKIVRHVARDMRQAMRAIRERLGEDAVILSSRRVAEGVELTAAIDFEAQSLDSAPLQPLSEPAESPLLRRAAATASAAASATPEVPHSSGPASSRESEFSREAVLSSRNGSLARRARAAIRDDDEPVRSKVPPTFDELPADGTAQRFDTGTPLISSELQTELLDSLVVRSDEGTHAPIPPVQHAPSVASTPAVGKAASFATHLAHAAQDVRPTPQTNTTQISDRRAAGQTVQPPPAHAMQVGAPAVDAARASLTQPSTAAMEVRAACATQPLDLDLTELADAPEPIRAPRPPASDVVGTELKNLRRMLETQLAQLAWNDMTRRAPVHTEMLRELSEIGIAQDLSSQITQQLSHDVDLTYARRFSIAALSQYLLVTGDRWLDNGGRIAFIGSTGVGKTMTLSKLAVRWVLRHGARDLALIAADNIRLGAQDQMRALGQLLGAPVYTPESFETLPTLLSKLQQRFILIDTPGSSLRDTQLSSRLAVLASSASQLQTALVLAASTQAGALEEVVKRFAPANPCSCVLTKVDEAASLGGALSVLIRARVPVSYVSEGQRVPEDLRPARALELVSHAVRLAKATGAAADEDLLRRRFGKTAHALT
jgi:flagellar biosynthesis protein FlhF